jgi:hypothetical protein
MLTAAIAAPKISFDAVAMISFSAVAEAVNIANRSFCASLSHLAPLGPV